MKRWVSSALALIITFSLALGGSACATEAVEEEIVSVPVEEVEPAVAVDAYEAEVVPEAVFDLPIEDGEAVAEPTETVEAEPAAEQDAPVYAAVADATEIREAPEGAVIATLAGEGVALVLSQAAEGWFEIALYTERGIITGCAAGENLRALDAEAMAAYMDALAVGGDAAAYDGDVNRPLALVACAFPEESEAPAEEAPEAPAEQPEEAVETDVGAPAEAPSEPAEPAEPAGPAEPEAAGETSETNDEEPTEPEGEAGTDADTQEEAEKPDTDGAEQAGEPETTDAAAMAVAAEASTAAEGSETAGDAEKTDAAATTDANASGENLTYAATGISLNFNALKMGLKERYSGLKAAGGSGAVTWSSSNKKVVSVDPATGALRALKKGRAVITATSGDGTSASVQVTVKAAPTKAKFKPAKVKVGAGERTVQLKLGLGKGCASAGTVYTSNNEGVATVDANGLVTSHAAGTAVITARTYNGKKATCKLTVFSVPAPSAIRLPRKLSMGVKETRNQLPVELVPEAGATSCTAEITWSSTDKKVVKVDPNTGAIRALKKGKATIVARTANGLKAKCKITVKKAPKKVALESTGKAVDVGATVQFSVKLPKGSAGGITWSSSDPAVATIDQNGLTSGVSAGKTTITARTYNGKTATATLTVAGGTTSAKSDVQVPESLAKLGIASYQNVYSADLSNEQKLEYVIYCAQNQLGKPYSYGKGYTNDDNPSGFDCSGLVYWCFNRAHIQLEQSAYKQGYDNKYTKISDIESLKRGDVVCFNTSSDGDLSDHTGIYLGNGYFIHASSGSSKRKVVVQSFTGDSISNDYYKRAFSWGRRILN